MLFFQTSGVLAWHSQAWRKLEEKTREWSQVFPWPSIGLQNGDLKHLHFISSWFVIQVRLLVHDPWFDEHMVAVLL